jgi:hypothetical protein
MVSPTKKRVVWTVIIVVLLTITLIPDSRKLLFEKHFFSDIDSIATKYVDASLVRASAAYILARSFNGVVSVVQESELQLEPGGIGVSVALGQALDPVNDLVERFSWVMLASLTSLGIQKVLIEITPFVSVQIVLVLALLSLLFGLWLPSTVRYDFSQLGKVLLFSAVLLRFAVPAMSYMNQQVYVAFLEDRHNQSIGQLEKTDANLGSRSFEEPRTNQDDMGTYVPEEGGKESTEPTSWWENQTNWWVLQINKVLQEINELKQTLETQVIDRAQKIADIEAMIETINKATGELVDRLVDLIVVFVLSTIALPLLFLWGILKLGRLVVGHGINGILPRMKE